MYYTARGKNLTQQDVLDINTAQKFLDIVSLNKPITSFFDTLQVKRIALAPFNHFTKCLLRTIDLQKVEVVGIYDQAYNKFPDGFEGINVYNYDEIEDSEVDLYIVTSNYYQNEIIDILQLKNISLGKIVGINTVLFGMERLKK